MVMSGVVRRAASRVVPLAIWASAGSQRYIHHQSSSALFATAVNNCHNGCNCHNCSRSLPEMSFPVLIRRFSTKPSSDESLLRVIESEIECAVESQEADQVEGVPDGFPFKIEDHPGQQTITLTREYQGETISVEVHMPDVITGEEVENEQDNDKDTGSKSSLPLVVRVSKKIGLSLEFGCTAYPYEIAIDSLSVKDPENSEDQIAYEGPEFLDLDENLQKAFHKYLEIREIKPSTTNFLHGYMVYKDGREYTTWLQNLQKFVKA